MWLEHHLRHIVQLWDHQSEMLEKLQESGEVQSLKGLIQERGLQGQVTLVWDLILELLEWK